MSKLVRNVPCVNSIEMSPCERPRVPVGAVENCPGVFQGAVGAFCASTAPAASTGASSSIGDLPQATLGLSLLISPAPRMVGARPPRVGRWRETSADDWRGTRHERGGEAGDFGPSHRPTAIFDREAPVRPLTHGDRAAGRGVATLARQLES